MQPLRWPCSPLAAGLLSLLLTGSGCSRLGGNEGARVLLTEIMYHPVAEPSPDEEHEFIEITNAGSEDADLTGWTLRGVKFTFPAGTVLSPGSYLVIAKNKKSLLAVTSYKLSSARVVGNFEGSLSNGGERVGLLDAAGKSADEVVYSDSFPWPAGADALGGSETWLPPENLPLDAHKFRGRSLERIAVSAPSGDPANWAPSPLDGATPGRPNASAGVPAAIATHLEVHATGRTDAFIRANQAPLVSMRFSRLGPATAPAIEYFVDDLERDDEPRARAILKAAGDGFEARLPRQKDGSIVRYRLLANRGHGEEIISPRPSDPFAWHAYFVSPELPGVTRPFQLFIKKQDWETLWDYIEAGRVPGNVSGSVPGLCAVNADWFSRVPAVFVADGRVYDVQARYQGSRTNRASGLPIDMTKWPAETPVPARPALFRVLSWHINFPRWSRFENKKSINLNKLTQACQGFATTVGYQLFEKAGIPGPQTEYARVYINGAYYHYMQRVEVPDEDHLLRFFGKDHVLGDLWKAEGARWDEGPYGFTDERPLPDYCGYTPSQRFAYSYKRQSLTDWRSDSDDVMNLVTGLHEARAGGLDRQRKFFADNFDLPLLLSYMAVINWMGPFDDFWQNHFLYKRADGKWMVMPQDMDLLMGGFVPPDGSFFVGAVNIRNNRSDYFSFLKDTFLRAYRAEFIAKLIELDRTVLSPQQVLPLIDDAAADYTLDEAAQSPAGMSCGGNPANLLDRMRHFAVARHWQVAMGLFD